MPSISFKKGEAIMISADTITSFLVLLVVLYILVKGHVHIANSGRRTEISDIFSEMEEIIAEMESIMELIAARMSTDQDIDRLKEISTNFFELDKECLLLLEDEAAYVNEYGSGAGSIASARYRLDSRRHDELAVRFGNVCEVVSYVMQEVLIKPMC